MDGTARGSTPQATETALRHSDGQRQREAGDWRGEEQADEPADSRQIHPDERQRNEWRRRRRFSKCSYPP